MTYEDVQDEPNDNDIDNIEIETDIEEEQERDPQERRKNPYQQKQLDYKHQARPVVAGEAARKVDKSLSQLVRRKQRRAMEAITQAAIDAVDEEQIDGAADAIKSLKPSHFTPAKIEKPKTVPLGEALAIKKQKRTSNDHSHDHKDSSNA